MADGLIKALWVASFEASAPGGIALIPNETVVDVPAGEAKASDNWKPVRAKKDAGGED